MASAEAVRSHRADATLTFNWAQDAENTQGMQDAGQGHWALMLIIRISFDTFIGAADISHFAGRRRRRSSKTDDEAGWEAARYGKWNV